MDTTYKFFKDIQKKIEELALLKSKLLDDNIEDNKVEFYRVYTNKVMEDYMLQDETNIEVYNELYNSIENCLKTNPERLQRYIKECPIMYEFILSYILCNVNSVPDSIIVAFKKLSKE